MKRDYLKPTIQVVELRNKSCLLGASRNLHFIGGNANMNYRGGGNGDARSRGCDDDWEDDWDDEW